MYNSASQQILIVWTSNTFSFFHETCHETYNTPIFHTGNMSQILLMFYVHIKINKNGRIVSFSPDMVLKSQYKLKNTAKRETLARLWNSRRWKWKSRKFPGGFNCSPEFRAYVHVSSAHFEDRHFESSTSSCPKLIVYLQNPFDVITRSLLQPFITRTQHTRISFIPKSIHQLTSTYSYRTFLENAIQKDRKQKKNGSDRNSSRHTWRYLKLLFVTAVCTVGNFPTKFLFLSITVTIYSGIVVQMYHLK